MGVLEDRKGELEQLIGKANVAIHAVSSVGSDLEDIEARLKVYDYIQTHHQAKFREVAREVGGLRKEFARKKGVVEQLQASLDYGALAIEDGTTEEDFTDGIVDITDALELARRYIRAETAEQYDLANAVITINCNERDIEDARNLLRAYEVFAQESGFTTEMIDTEDENTTRHLEIRGEGAYGLFREEHGVHLFIREQSGRRVRELVSVGVEPVDTTQTRKIADNEISYEFLKGRGPGGQHVQKNATTVRAKHVGSGDVTGTGISVIISGRHKERNRGLATRILRARVTDHYNLQTGDPGESWEVALTGRQFRTYRLVGEPTLTDRKSNYKATNPEEVLKGDFSAVVNASHGIHF